MERWHVKVICGIIMLVAMLVCFLLPIKLSVFFRRRGDNGQYYLDLLACFAGGVFLAAYLLFMAPAVRELLFENLMKPNGINYPLPDMLIGIGFFILLLLNRLVISMSKISKKRKDALVNGNSHQPKNGSITLTNISLLSTTSTARERSFDPCEASRCNTGTHLVEMDSVNDSVDVRRRTGLPDEVVEMSPVDEEDLVFHAHSHSPYPLPRRSSIADVAQQDSTVRSIVMMLALSLDSVLEGVTTGLKTTIIEVWAIFIGNLVHETVIAFCLGLQLVRVHNDNVRPVVLAAVAYSLMNPIGLALATIVFETLEADPRIDLFNGLFQALTSGCFIYVTFCEILEGQITHRTSYAKIGCMFAGFALLAVFAAVPGSSPYEFVPETHCLNQTSMTTTGSPTSGHT